MTAEQGLTLIGLDKRFGEVRALDGVSLTFRPARVSGLIGPNSAGKTTLLKAVMGLVRPDRGSVLLGEEEVDAAGAYRERIGYMPQLPAFPEQMTGHDLVAMIDDLRSFTGDPDEDLVDALDIREEMDKPFGTLSGGTRQKVNAALAFRYRAPLLILDEPTAGLDPVSSLTLKQKIEERRQDGCTVVITSHDLGSLQSRTDDVVFLLEGRLRFHASLDELLEETGKRSLEAAIAELMLRAVEAPDDEAGMPGKAAESERGAA